MHKVPKRGAVAPPRGTRRTGDQGYAWTGNSDRAIWGSLRPLASATPTVRKSQSPAYESPVLIAHISPADVDSPSNKCIPQRHPRGSSHKAVGELEVSACPIRAVSSIGTAKHVGDLVEDGELFAPVRGNADDPSIALGFRSADRLHTA